MNPEKLILMASIAIDKFKQLNDTVCTLYIDAGEVVCRKGRPANRQYPEILVVTQFRQRAGFSSAEWHTIGSALLILYNTEASCQAHPKH